jgi:hypothetical protein
MMDFFLLFAIITAAYFVVVWLILLWRDCHDTGGGDG